MPNDFSGDGNAVAVWNVDNGFLTTDSKGTNTLTDNNTVGTNTTDYQQGDASADFERNNSECLSITDANLDSGFPLKSGDTNKKISAVFWYRRESTPSLAGLFAKWDSGANKRSFYLRDDNGTLDYFIGTGTGAGFELLDESLSTSQNVWYHVGVTFDDSDKSWKLRVWDDTAGSVVLNASGTATNNIAITDAGITLGCSLNSGVHERFFDGEQDEIVVFDDILTTGEIDQIRAGTYSAAAAGTANLINRNSQLLRGKI
jgi:hypothetical protein